MPIYEYACEKCKEEFEVSQRITEDALTVHEGCGGAVKRLISRTSFALKGDGWYSDHYGLKSKRDPPPTAGAAATPKNGSEKKAGGDSKPEAKSEASSGAETKKATGGDQAKKGSGKAAKSSGPAAD